MAKKTKKEENNFAETIKEIFKSTLLKQIGKFTSQGIENARMRIYEIERKAIKNILTSISLMTGIIFILLSVTFLLQEYTQLSYGWTFLIIGMAIIILSQLFKLLMR